MKIPHLLLLVMGVILISAGAYCAWLPRSGEDADGAFWNYDGVPRGETLSVLLAAGYPPSITRMVEQGSARRSAPYKKLMILCFPVADLERVKQAAAGQGTWERGLPEEANWRRVADELAPTDLVLPKQLSASSYLHLRSPDAEAYSYGRHKVVSQWTVIDTRQGIVYQIDTGG